MHLILALSLLLIGTRGMEQPHAGRWHPWFAWVPVRTIGGDPIPTVQEGGKVVWLRSVEREAFFGRWLFRIPGDTRTGP